MPNYPGSLVTLIPRLVSSLVTCLVSCLSPPSPSQAPRSPLSLVLVLSRLCPDRVYTCSTTSCPRLWPRPSSCPPPLGLLSSPTLPRMCLRPSQTYKSKSEPSSHTLSRVASVIAPSDQSSRTHHPLPSHLPSSSLAPPQFRPLISWSTPRLVQRYRLRAIVERP